MPIKSLILPLLLVPFLMVRGKSFILPFRVLSYPDIRFVTFFVGKSPFVAEYQINFIEQYRFVDFKNRIYDFAIFDKQNNLVQLLEFDGQQHFCEVPGWSGSLEERKKRDKEKDEYARQHNIPLIRICYLEKGKINIEKILKSEVRKIYGL